MALRNQALNFISGVADWDMQSNRIVRSSFKPGDQHTAFRLKEGWAGQPGGKLKNVLTGQTFYQLADNEGLLGSAVSDPDTGEVFRVNQDQLERTVNLFSLK